MIPSLVQYQWRTKLNSSYFIYYHTFMIYFQTMTILSNLCVPFSLFTSLRTESVETSINKRNQLLPGLVRSDTLHCKIKACQIHTVDNLTLSVRVSIANQQTSLVVSKIDSAYVNMSEA